MMKKREVIIIGGGPSGLMAATQLIVAGFQVTIVDHKAAVGRKFLVAGDGGFNLTHSEQLDRFVERYNHPFPKQWVSQFTPNDFRQWLLSIGIKTFVGSSGKVFPVEGTKPIEVLKAWTDYLTKNGVIWKLNTHFKDFSDEIVVLQQYEKEIKCRFDALIFATGGGSWKKTGSDGTWLDLFQRKGIPVRPFESSNSGLMLSDAVWLRKNEGAIIKNIRLSCGSVDVSGDIVVTKYGLEGKPAYAVNGQLRNNHFQGLFMDCKPQFSLEKVRDVFKNYSSVRKAWSVLRLPEVLYTWMRESIEKEEFTDPDKMAAYIKAFPVPVIGLRPLDEVISTVGGVEMDAVDASGKLRNFQNVYCCGEMLDWDAPTGGYLIQGCVASGYAVGNAVKKLD